MAFNPTNVTQDHQKFHTTDRDLTLTQPFQSHALHLERQTRGNSHFWSTFTNHHLPPQMNVQASLPSWPRQRHFASSDYGTSSPIHALLNPDEPETSRTVYTASSSRSQNHPAPLGRLWTPGNSTHDRGQRPVLLGQTRSGHSSPTYMENEDGSDWDDIDESSLNSDSDTGLALEELEALFQPSSEASGHTPSSSQGLAESHDYDSAYHSGSNSQQPTSIDLTGDSPPQFTNSMAPPRKRRTSIRSTSGSSPIALANTHPKRRKTERSGSLRTQHASVVAGPSTVTPSKLHIKPRSKGPKLQDRTIEDIDLAGDDDEVSATLQKQRQQQIELQTPNSSEDGGSSSGGRSKLNILTCTVCLEPPTDLTATTCGHLFCRTCLLDWLITAEKDFGGGRRGSCPACRKGLSWRRKGDVTVLALMVGPKRQGAQASETQQTLSSGSASKV